MKQDKVFANFIKELSGAKTCILFLIFHLNKAYPTKNGTSAKQLEPLTKVFVGKLRQFCITNCKRK